MPVAEVLILLILMLIFWQDVVSRSVYWFLFPVLAILLLFVRWKSNDHFDDVWQACAINLVFIAVQLLVLTIYFSVKNKRFINISNDLLGLGDILFLLCAALYFSVLNFVVFYIGSMIIVLLIWMVWQLISKTKNKHIPLAGLQALIFALFLMSDWYIIHLHLTDDSWLTNLLMK